MPASPGTAQQITFRPIGVIRSPHTDPRRTPIQPAYARGIKGSVEVFSEFADGLLDLEGFSHIFLIYCFHRAGEVRLVVKPFLEDTPHGVFATRAPRRPSPIGFSVVRLVKRDGNVLHVEDVDILDGTPLLDIKPYVARFDRLEGVRSGWQDRVDEETARVRGRRQYPADPDVP